MTKNAEREGFQKAYGEVIKALADIVANAPQTDEQCEAELIPRPYVMDRVVRIIEAMHTLSKLWQARAQASGVPDGWVLLPRELTAENGAKYALIGEIPCHIDGMRGSVPWASIKEVHKAVVRLFGGKEPSPAAPTPPKSASVPVEKLEAALAQAKVLNTESFAEVSYRYLRDTLAELIAEYKA
jgi:hypothetical protein